MKKKSASKFVPVRRNLSTRRILATRLVGEGGFFNLRVLIGLCIALAGISLALAGLDAFAANSASVKIRNHIITASNDALVPVGFDCSKIEERGINKQENFRAGAIMIACAADGASGSSSVGGFLQRVTQGVKSILLPLFGAGDVNLVNHAETSPNITQSETFTTANPDNPNQIVVAYNDSRGRAFTPVNLSGASVSTDGGATFDRVTLSNGQGPFTNTIGDPVLLFNKPTGTWYTVWLDIACGGQGLGGYKSTTPWDAASWTHYNCVHSGSADDRESGWADNNPSSPFFGRMYVSWNDFNRGGGGLFVRYSTDNGLTWTNERQVTTTFFRNVQITGDKVTGDLYIAGMDENGGTGCNNNSCGTSRTNKIYRSTDGGNTWTNTYTGPSFVGPCRGSAGYFCTMYFNPAYWRHMGWGEPAAYNHVVSYVYSAKNGNDPGDVFYIRSPDSGVTFSAPFRLNSNTDVSKAQWQPNLSVSDGGTLLATWYDETPRTSASCQPSSPTNLCYQMHSRKSNDNGLSWSADDVLSDVASPLPLQPDPGVAPTYVGDYDYGSASLTKHVTSWTDGRVAISGQSQQDAFTDRELVGFGVTTTDPACNSAMNTQPTDFVINLTGAVNTATVEAGDFTVNGIPSQQAPTFANGNTQITFHFSASPVSMVGPQTMNIPAGAFNSASDNTPNLAFNCSFCYVLVPLQVTATNPPVGGTFSPPAPGNYQYDVNFNQGIDPASVTTADLMLSGNAGGSVTNVQVINGNTTARFTVHFNFGGSVTASLGAGAITANTCNGNSAFTGNYTILGCPPPDHYTISQIPATIVPGTTDIGNHGDDPVTNVALPFSYTLYDQTFTSVNLGANGNAQFVTAETNFGNQCPPWIAHNYTIFPYWDDLETTTSGLGIFTSISGSTPNRIFNIEWRTQYYPGNGTANFELRLYEGQSRFDIIYGSVTNGNTTATAGVQKNDNAFDQYFCNGSGGAATGGQSYILQSCTSPTPTATAAATATATATPRATATATATVTATATATASSTATAKATSTPSATVPPSPTPTATVTPTATPAGTPTATPTSTATPTATPTPCTSPAAPNIQSATNLTFSSFTAHWTSVSGATGYLLDVSTSNTFTTYVPGYQNLDVGDVTSYNVTGLSPNTTYYYRLRAYNGCGTSANSSVKNVKTLACTPAAPRVQSATNVTFNSFSAVWSSVAGAIDYRLDVSTSNSFITYVPGYQDVSVGNMTSYPVTGLSAHTTYYYRVRANNGCGTSANSSAKSVQTLACTPAAPSAQSATNVTASSFSANWRSVSGAIDYRLDVSTSSSFTTYVAGYQNLSVGNMISFPVTGLSAHTTYYYRVRAYNGCGTSANSSVKSVQTSP